MKIAILLKGTQDDILKCRMRLVLLTTKNKRVEKVTNEDVQMQNIHQFTFWLLVHQISLICVQETDDETKKYYSRFGIEIKTFEESIEDPILKSFFCNYI